jgi:hypothetical protein
MNSEKNSESFSKKDYIDPIEQEIKARRKALEEKKEQERLEQQAELERLKQENEKKSASTKAMFGRAIQFQKILQKKEKDSSLLPSSPALPPTTAPFPKAIQSSSSPPIPSPHLPTTTPQSPATSFENQEPVSIKKRSEEDLEKIFTSWQSPKTLSKSLSSANLPLNSLMPPEKTEEEKPELLTPPFSSSLETGKKTNSENPLSSSEQKTSEISPKTSLLSSSTETLEKSSREESTSLSSSHLLSERAQEAPSSGLEADPFVADTQEAPSSGLEADPFVADTQEVPSSGLEADPFVADTQEVPSSGLEADPFVADTQEAPSSGLEADPFVADTQEAPSSGLEADPFVADTQEAPSSGLEADPFVADTQEAPSSGLEADPFVADTQEAPSSGLEADPFVADTQEAPSSGLEADPFVADTQEAPSSEKNEKFMPARSFEEVALQETLFAELPQISKMPTDSLETHLAHALEGERTTSAKLFAPKKVSERELLDTISLESSDLLKESVPSALPCEFPISQQDTMAFEPPPEESDPNATRFSEDPTEEDGITRTADEPPTITRDFFAIQCTLNTDPLNDTARSYSFSNAI